MNSRTTKRACRGFFRIANNRPKLDNVSDRGIKYNIKKDNRARVVFDIPPEDNPTRRKPRVGQSIQRKFNYRTPYHYIAFINRGFKEQKREYFTYSYRPNRDVVPLLEERKHWLIDPPDKIDDDYIVILE